MKVTSQRQALSLAISMEEGAIRLYDRARRMPEGKIAACAEQLYRDECRHLMDFSGMLSECEKHSDGEAEETDLWSAKDPIGLTNAENHPTNAADLAIRNDTNSGIHPSGACGQASVSAADSELGSEDEAFLSDALGEGLLFPGGLTAAARDGHMESCVELMQAAIEAEARSVAFYRKAAESRLLTDEARKAFLRIALQEEEHRSEWQERLDRHQKSDKL